MCESEVEFLRRTGEGSAYRPLNFCRITGPRKTTRSFGGLTSGAGNTTDYAPRQKVTLQNGGRKDGHDLCAP